MNPENTLLYQFHAQKALFLVPKIYNMNVWIENDPPPPHPPPLELSRKPLSLQNGNFIESVSE